MEKPRIVGQETEYGILVLPNDSIAACKAFQWNALTKVLYYPILSGWRPPEDSPQLLSDVPDNACSAFLANGARFYLECAGNHPEYATPECLGPRQLVLAEQAGDRLLEKFQRQANLYLKDTAVYNQYQISLYKNNVDLTNRDWSGASWGCHENYLVKRETFRKFTSNNESLLFTDIFTAYLVSSVIYTGSGDIRSFDDGSLAFFISQRANFVGSIMATSTTGLLRPLISSRDEALGDAAKYGRLHVIGRDANMSPLATFLKFGTASIILDMLESDPDIFKKEWIINEPVTSLKIFSADIGLKEKVWCRNNSDSLKTAQFTALELQKIFFERAANFVERSGSEEDKLVIRHWRQILDTLDEYDEEPESLIGKVDWITKKFIIENKLAKISGNDFKGDFFRLLEFASRSSEKYGTGPGRQASLADLAKTINVQYHDIRREKGLFYRFAQVPEFVAAEEEINLHLDEAPKGGRAELRGFLIREFESRDKSHYNIYFDWQALTAFPKEEFGLTSDLSKENIYFLDPYDRRLTRESCEKLMGLGILDDLPERFKPNKNPVRKF